MSKGMYLWLYGGYGDCACAYLNGGCGKRNTVREDKCGRGSMQWDKLISIKKQIPNVVTRAIVMSGNPESMLLVASNPYIDEVIRIPTLRGVNTVSERVRNYIVKHIVSHRDIDEFIHNSKDKYKSITNKIYLNPMEENIYDEIQEKTKGKYIVIHPYASIKGRRPVHDSEYVNLAERIHKETGLMSVVLGGTFRKKAILTDGTQLNSTVNENFNYKSPVIVNLVNEVNLLVGTQLVNNSAAVVGAWSCHTTVGMAIRKPTVMYTTQSAMGFLKKIKARKFKQGASFNKTFITDKITDKITKTTIQHISKYL